MKRRIFLILAMVLTLSLFLASCTFTVDFSGCVGTNTGTSTGTQLTPDVDNSITSFEMVMKKDGAFYYPEFSGKVRYSFYPEKTTVEIDGIEYNLTPKTVKLDKGTYLLTFDEIIPLNYISKGSHILTVYGYQYGEKNSIAEKFTWEVDDDYSACSFFDFATGKTGWGLDKESNWTPFY